ncbi:MAG: DUF4493 domain-containing protein [Rikenellaceae bacterium]
MRRRILNLITISTMLLAVSCNAVEDLQESFKGFGKLLVPTTKVSGEYKGEDGVNATVPYNVKDFIVTIAKYENGVLTPINGKKWKVADMPAKIGLPVGQYAIQTASYEGKQLEVSDNPYFYGTKDFSIMAEEETSVDVNVAVIDAKVSALLTDAFKAEFSEWSVTVVSKADATKKLFELNETTLTKYIKPTDIILNVECVRHNSSSTWKKSIPMSGVVSGDWVKVSLNVDGVGSVTVNITVDNTLTEKEVIIDIPNDDEDLGGGGTVTPDPDPNPDPDPDVPTFEKPAVVGIEGLNIDNELVILKSETLSPVKIAIKADNGGIQKLNVTISSQEAWLMTAVKAMFDGKNTFDLANLKEGSDTKNNLISLGIVTNETIIKDQKSFVFDITKFMGLLSPNSNDTNSYDFIIGVEDIVGDAAQKTLVVKVRK